MEKKPIGHFIWSWRNDNGFCEGVYQSVRLKTERGAMNRARELLCDYDCYGCVPYYSLFDGSYEKAEERARYEIDHCDEITRYL